MEWSCFDVHEPSYGIVATKRRVGAGREIPILCGAYTLRCISRQLLLPLREAAR